ncbi:uncharacterized protein BDR25DRAFT_393893 [Lindgomyces ingoldianus]|uniref:Uncharacterized protein n=1 Tax=Lindgomyces ingoldianus TaxID=673940 RepID=A0ACB6QU33_9PLEO|nr:uncharacterized protein BDR25DRAFT_393893 [Lindgomyces ingoldianus]KAF2470372.1 hypothetical protein BDR25DRAFT_393893 [Lindgomyces ingoldianus]
MQKCGTERSSVHPEAHVSDKSGEVQRERGTRWQLLSAALQAFTNARAEAENARSKKARLFDVGHKSDKWASRYRNSASDRRMCCWRSAVQVFDPGDFEFEKRYEVVPGGLKATKKSSFGEPFGAALSNNKMQRPKGKRSFLRGEKKVAGVLKQRNKYFEVRLARRTAPCWQNRREAQAKVEHASFLKRTRQSKRNNSKRLSEWRSQGARILIAPGRNSSVGQPLQGLALQQMERIPVRRLQTHYRWASDMVSLTKDPVSCTPGLGQVGNTSNAARPRVFERLATFDAPWSELFICKHQRTSPPNSPRFQPRADCTRWAEKLRYASVSNRPSADLIELLFCSLKAPSLRLTLAQMGSYPFMAMAFIGWEAISSRTATHLGGSQVVFLRWHFLRKVRNTHRDDPYWFLSCTVRLQGWQPKTTMDCSIHIELLIGLLELKYCCELTVSEEALLPLSWAGKKQHRFHYNNHRQPRGRACRTTLTTPSYKNGWTCCSSPLSCLNHEEPPADPPASEMGHEPWVPRIVCLLFFVEKNNLNMAYLYVMSVRVGEYDWLTSYRTITAPNCLTALRDPYIDWMCMGQSISQNGCEEPPDQHEIFRSAWLLSQSVAILPISDMRKCGEPDFELVQDPPLHKLYDCTTSKFAHWPVGAKMTPLPSLTLPPSREASLANALFLMDREVGLTTQPRWRPDLSNSLGTLRELVESGREWYEDMLNRTMTLSRYRANCSLRLTKARLLDARIRFRSSHKDVSRGKTSPTISDTSHGTLIISVSSLVFWLTDISALPDCTEDTSTENPSGISNRKPRPKPEADHLIAHDLLQITAHLCADLTISLLTIAAPSKKPQSRSTNLKNANFPAPIAFYHSLNMTNHVFDITTVMGQTKSVGQYGKVYGKALSLSSSIFATFDYVGATSAPFSDLGATRVLFPYLHIYKNTFLIHRSFHEHMGRISLFRQATLPIASSCANMCFIAPTLCYMSHTANECFTISISTTYAPNPGNSDCGGNLQKLLTGLVSTPHRLLNPLPFLLFPVSNHRTLVSSIEAISRWPGSTKRPPSQHLISISNIANRFFHPHSIPSANTVIVSVRMSNPFHLDSPAHNPASTPTKTSRRLNQQANMAYRTNPLSLIPHTTSRRYDIRAVYETTAPAAARKISPRDSRLFSSLSGSSQEETLPHHASRADLCTRLCKKDEVRERWLRSSRWITSRIDDLGMRNPGRRAASLRVLRHTDSRTEERDSKPPDFAI